MVRTTQPYNPEEKIRQELLQELLSNPVLAIRELHRRSFYEFFQYFWSEISSDELVLNWHIKYLCDELQQVAERVGQNKPKLYDLIINIPPGTSKTSIALKLFPVWCWTKWFHLRFITASYSQVLSLESGEASRDLIRSDKFKTIYPELVIKEDKDVKSNYKIVKRVQKSKGHLPQLLNGGNRYSTSVGGSVTGFHGHILLVDDPLNPHVAMSKVQIATTNKWIDQVISTRKVDKLITPMILIMQRLHQNDPSGHILAKKKKNVKHICLPADINEYGDSLEPKELKQHYVNGLLDPVRLSKTILNDMLADLGQYGYAGQMGQKPTPPGGGMFKVDNISIVHQLPLEHDIESQVRYWDKAGTQDAGAYTAGTRMLKTKQGRYIIVNVKRGQWSTEVRENIIKQTAESDGKKITIGIEQEPGSGGKESADATIKNLAGFLVYKEQPKGDKAFRADPFSVQVNNGNVSLLYGDWNHEYIEELRHFPFSTYKDQVDASSGAFAKLTSKRIARTQ